MQTHTTVRGYSDFFASGFRAVTTRPPSVSSSSRNSLEPITNNSTTHQPRRSFVGIGIGAQRRPRPASMIVSSITKPEEPQRREKKTTSSTSSASSSSSVQGRRSSFVSFSSRLFERMTSSVGNDENTASSNSNSNSRRSSRNFRFFQSSSDESLPEVWITTGGPHTPSAPNGSAALHQSIDPFNSSPDTRSMFIDLTPSSSDCSPTGTPKRESFLSLTGTSPIPSPSSSTHSRSRSRSSSSSIHLFTRRDNHNHRERPRSIHTMPLPLPVNANASVNSRSPRPSESRRSSFSLHHYRSSSQEKSAADFFLIVEEEPTTFLLASASAGVNAGGHGHGHGHQPPILEDEHEERDAPAKIDWRQFHIDILTDE